MKKTSNEDKLRQTIGNFQPQAPDNAWERLVPHLPEKKRRRPVFFWWPYLAGASIVAVTLGFYSLPENGSSAIEPNIENRTDFAPQQAAGYSGTAAASAAAIKDYVRTMDANTAGTGNITPQKSQSFFHQSTVSIEPAATGLVQEATSPVTQPSVPSLNPENQKTALAFLPGIDSGEFLFQHSPAPMTPALLSLTKKAPPKSPFILAVWSGPAIFMQRQQTAAPVGLAFEEMNSGFSTGWETGVSAGIRPIPKWQLSIGLNRLSAHQHSSHQATLRLNDGRLLNPSTSGIKQYEFKYGLVANRQRSELTLRIDEQEPGSAMPADEPFTLDMHTIRNTTFYRLPVSVLREFGQGKWRGYLSAGAAIDFHDRTSLHVIHFSETCQDLCFANGLIPEFTNHSQVPLRMSWVFSGGVERHLAQHLAIKIRPSFAVNKQQFQAAASLGFIYK